MTSAPDTKDRQARKDRRWAYLYGPLIGGIVAGAAFGGSWWAAGIGGIVGGGVARRITGLES